MGRHWCDSCPCPYHTWKLTMAMWKGKYPKKIKFFLCELALKAIHTQKLNSSDGHFSQVVSIMREIKSFKISSSFIALSRGGYGQKIATTLDGLGATHWCVHVKDILGSLLLYHPFKNDKVLLWLQFTHYPCSLLGFLEGKKSKKTSFAVFFDLVIYDYSLGVKVHLFLLHTPMLSYWWIGKAFCHHYVFYPFWFLLEGIPGP